MVIGKFSVHSIYDEDFKISDYNSGKNNWDIKVSVEVNRTPVPKEFTISICIDVLRLKLIKKATIKVYTQYLVTTESTDFKPLNDNDYYFYADLIKSAFDHARVIIDQRFKGTDMQGGYLRIDPIQKYYLDVKNGNVHFLN